MDINNNQQTNTFSKGMNTDTSDMYIQNDQYRYAENLRFLTNEGENSGELRSIENWKKLLFIDERQNLVLFANIIATTSIRNYGIIIDNPEYTDYTDKVTYKTIRDNTTNKLYHSFAKDDSIVNKDIVVEYWLPRAPKASTLMIKAGQKTYTIEKINPATTYTIERAYYGGWSIWRTEGNVAIKIFGPCGDTIGKHPSLVTRYESEGNVKLYIADGAHSLMSINVLHDDGDQYSILYLIQNNIALSSIQPTISSNAGILKPAIVLYCYYLYKEGGKRTDVSPLSQAISLYDEKKGYANSLTTNKAVDIHAQLPINYTPYNKIRIYRITYVENGQLPTIHLICDTKITNRNVFVLDTGYNIEEVGFSEFVAQTNIKFTPAVIESKNDYLFAANVKYTQQDIDEQFKDFTCTYNLDYGVYDLSDQGSPVVHPYNPSTSVYGRSLMCGETYRYGVRFQTTDGEFTSVFYIDDITVPNLSEIQDFVKYRGSGSNLQIKKIGVKFNITVPGAIEDICAGYEIVRCNRSIQDSKTICQGIIGRAKCPDDVDGNVTTNTYADVFMRINTIPRETWSVYLTWSDSIFMFASPEHVYQADDIQQIVDLNENNLSLNLICRYIPNISNNRIGNSGAFYRDGHVSYDVTAYSKIPSIGRYVTMNVVSPKDDEENNPSVKYEENNAFKINSVAFTTAPAFNTFETDDLVRIYDDVTAIGDSLFVNWDASGILLSGVYTNRETVKDAYSTKSILFYDNVEHNTNLTFKGRVSTGKKCILLNVEKFLNPHPYEDDELLTYVANITKPAVPYGGKGKNLETSIYYSFGNYTDYTKGGTSITVFDGDVYNGIFVYNSGHAWYSPNYRAYMQPTVYMIPIQTRIDLLATYGDLYTRSTSSAPLKFLFQDEPAKIGDYLQNLPAYLYNTAYSTLISAMSSTSLKELSTITDLFDIRVLYSKPKSNGESIDNWTWFLAANFIDVDTRFGQLTELRLFKDALMFWQDNATGVLSVNERTILQDVNDTNIILGNGDVLQRYDYLTTEYGMKPGQFADTQSNATLYWWDGYKKEILGYSGGQAVMPMNKIKTVSNYINQHDEVADPELTYDYKYNEVLMNVVEGGTLVYNELMLQFSSIYTKQFDHSIRLNDTLLLAHNDNMYEWSHKWMSNEQNTYLPSKLKYIVNNNPLFVKTYDITTFGLGEQYHKEGDNRLKDLVFEFDTKDQHSELKDWSIEKGVKKYKERGRITNREYDYRFDIPRYGNEDWGNRMKGKVMRCELTVDNSADFSIQYITTKYRISFS